MLVIKTINSGHFLSFFFAGGGTVKDPQMAPPSAGLSRVSHINTIMTPFTPQISICRIDSEKMGPVFGIVIEYI
jgi:hypothetical protein